MPKLLAERRRMARSVKKAGTVFTVSGARGNAGSDLFVKIPIPGGGTIKVLDRRTFEGAVAAANSSFKESVAKILKEQWSSKEK